MSKLHTDTNPEETTEWLEALEAVLEAEGPLRAHYLLESLMDKTRRSGSNLPYKATTAYRNTIAPHQEEKLDGDSVMEKKIAALIRWNAVAMVLRAGKKAPDVGGHIASYASAATLYEVGFNHFFKGPDADPGADLIFFQGHSSPGIYARAYLEGRLSESQLENFRQEVGGEGLSSYPHPWLMPNFWQCATVSMGLGPLMAIYQARFFKYLEHRGLAKTQGRKIWTFCGDGEMDEPESTGAISLAGREKLDNLIFVINCNLQRLDGPVRGNGSVIDELEGLFRGAGWNVIKVIWGRHWDPLFAKDKDGILQKCMEETVDGEYQNYKANDGAYVREHFFGKYPELKEMVAHMSDNDVWRLNRGGHDAYKVYAAYAAAVKHTGQPTVILTKTVKGFGMGAAGEGRNITHQQKKMGVEDLKAFRDRFDIPIADEDVANAPFYRPDEDSPLGQYIRSRRKALGGSLPTRRAQCEETLKMPTLDAFASITAGFGDREISTTMAFVRLLNILVKDKTIGQRVVPIVPDECRTFGMEGMFRQLGIYSSMGQLYTPEDKDQVMFYKEDKKGQILEEGINEAGAMASWVAAATAYSNHNLAMIPFYIYYSMFGFQRTGDLAWAAGDMQARGFIIGGTAGRTTLAGEGLQHQDGQSHLQASIIPNCIAYDSTYAYELAVIVQDGLRRMIQNQENVFFYITVMNENYTHPAMPKGVEAGILQGMYRLNQGEKGKHKIQLLGSGTILLEVLAAQKLLQDDYNVSSDVWSVTSFTELRRDGLKTTRDNLFNPEKKAKQAYVTQCLEKAEGPVIAATDYMKLHADQIREYIPQRYHVLGTDGYGRSDTREALRHHFEVNRYFIVLASLKALVEEGALPASAVTEAMNKYAINADKADPLYC